MQSLKVMATIDGALYEVEAKQTDSHRAHFEIIHQGQQIADLHKENETWVSDPEDCLLPEEVKAIGKTIDSHFGRQF